MTRVGAGAGVVVVTCQMSNTSGREVDVNKNTISPRKRDHIKKRRKKKSQGQIDIFCGLWFGFCLFTYSPFHLSQTLVIPEWRPDWTGS